MKVDLHVQFEIPDDETPEGGTQTIENDVRDMIEGGEIGTGGEAIPVPYSMTVTFITVEEI